MKPQDLVFGFFPALIGSPLYAHLAWTLIFFMSFVFFLMNYFQDSN